MSTETVASPEDRDGAVLAPSAGCSTAHSLVCTDVCTAVLLTLLLLWECLATGRLPAAPEGGPPAVAGGGLPARGLQRAERATQRSVKSVAAPQRCLPMATQGCPADRLGSPVGSKSFMSTFTLSSFAPSFLSVLSRQATQDNE